MITHTRTFTVPAGYALLPVAMCSREATALTLAIGLQESRFLARRQMGDGPARGFWQFERGGVSGVLHHAASRMPIGDALRALMYTPGASGWGVTECHDAIESNDTLAFCFARCLLWTLPQALPGRGDADLAWLQYLAGWRPGKPHRASWDACYAQSWALVSDS